MSTSSHKQSIHVRNSNSDVILFCNVLVRCKVRWRYEVHV